MSFKYKWSPVTEENAEDSAHTMYVAKMIDGRLVLLERLVDGCWDVEIECAPGYGVFTSPKATCKTLTSAKRWVARNLRFRGQL